MDDIRNQVGARIKYFRQLKGFSQEKLALMADINPSFLGHIERGLKSPTITTLDKIVNALNISLYEFFDFNKNSYSDTNSALIEKINLAIRDLSSTDISHIANIIDEIIKFKAK